MKKIYIVAVFAAVLSFLPGICYGVQKGGAGSSYEEIFPGTIETTAGINFGDGLQTTTTATSSVQVVFDGGGAVIETGSAIDVVIPFKCTLQRMELIADQVGTIEVKMEKSTYAAYPDGLADMGGGSYATITNAKKAEVQLSGWTTSIASGDIIRMSVNSCTAIERCLVSLRVWRTR